jgi:hypothetical protein
LRIVYNGCQHQKDGCEEDQYGDDDRNLGREERNVFSTISLAFTKSEIYACIDADCLKMCFIWLTYMFGMNMRCIR